MAEYPPFLVTYYDTFMGDYTSILEVISVLFEKYKPAHTTSILELACGTGNILKAFSRSYTLSGLDISSKMLAIAKKKVPYATYYHKNMTHFDLHETFDVILCIYDSINHLEKFRDWDKTFECVNLHLNPNGIFIFDADMPSMLNRQAKMPLFQKQLDATTTLFVKVHKKTQQKFIFEFTFKTFKGKNQSVNIVERVYTLPRILPALNKYFRVVTLYDSKLKKVASETSERIFFVCKKK